MAGRLRLLDHYVMRQLGGTTALIALVLAGILLMTQSLRFLELIIESGASGLAFVTLSLLALPRFFEVILPISLAAGTVFIYTRLRKEGELTVMQAAGLSPRTIAWPGLCAAMVTGLIMFILLAWLAPMTLSRMQNLRQEIRAQYAGLLLREGVFNALGQVTVYVAERGENGELKGVMINDARAENPTPVTILARRGSLVETPTGQQIIVYDGARQVHKPLTGALERLNFAQYTIDLPDQAPIAQRWAEPDERTLTRLLFPDPKDQVAEQQKAQFTVELHRRLVSPFLAPCFFLVAVAFLLLTPFQRTWAGRNIAAIATVLLTIQSLYLGAFSTARAHPEWGIVAMYLTVFIPMITAAYLLHRASTPLPSSHPQAAA